jgi:hypothetical protein
MTTTEEAIRMLRTLVESAGGTLMQVEHVLSLGYADALVRQNSGPLQQVHEWAMAGFFHCAAASRTFADVGRVRAYYGRSLEEAYPGATPTFMKLARTYWTFKVVLVDCGPGSSMCVKLLWAIDETFRSVFFPTPGPASVSKSLRETTMRDFIVSSGAQLDVDDYIRGNYYLQ